MNRINIQKTCLHCGEIFTARSTTTKYCSRQCNSKDYKANKRNKIVGQELVKAEREVFEAKFIYKTETIFKHHGSLAFYRRFASDHLCVHKKQRIESNEVGKQNVDKYR